MGRKSHLFKDQNKSLDDIEAGKKRSIFGALRESHAPGGVP
jgi:hypothetical protein